LEEISDGDGLTIGPFVGAAQQNGVVIFIQRGDSYPTVAA
jgi:hypothetical protein